MEKTDSPKMIRFKSRVDSPISRGLERIANSATDIGQNQVFCAIVKALGSGSLDKVKQQMRSDGTLRQTN